MESPDLSFLESSGHTRSVKPFSNISENQITFRFL